MRIPLVRYALILLATLVLVGCKSSESSVHPSTWSLSKLNPFSKDSDEAAYPPKPSGLAAPSVNSPSGAGYADASSVAPGQGEYANVAPSYSPSASPYPGSPYPSASAGSLAGSAPLTNPATTPQSGYYDTGSGYGLAGRPGSTPSYQSSVSPGAAATNSQYGTSTPAPRYGVVADRYGLNRGPAQPSTDLSASEGSAATYPSMPSYDSQTTSAQGVGPRYETATSPEYRATSEPRYGLDSNASGPSVADSRHDRVPSYGSDARSLVGDRYTSEDTQAAGFNSYRNGQLGNSSADTSWNPGQTGYAPGQSDYEPGNTGYQPPGTVPYRSPADSYPASPFLPGSTRSYAPRTMSGSATPEASRSDSQGQPTADSQVIPAGHTPLWPTRTF